MKAQAVIFKEPGVLAVDAVDLTDPVENDCVIETLWSGISTGTERLLYSGKMPPFPGMGYPLVPGYESVGEIVDARGAARERIGERVFVPGCSAYRDVKGLFGGSASRLVAPSEKLISVDRTLGSSAVLMALAATAHHAVAGAASSVFPDLIIGHGVLGQLAARTVIALGGKAPTVLETDARRREGEFDYPVDDPATYEASGHSCILDVSGASDLLDELISRIGKGGEIVLGGFYHDRINFAFPPAFMKEVRLRVAAEWKPSDLQSAQRLIGEGRLSLAGLVTHACGSSKASQAYETAFGDPDCLKMVLDWEDPQ